eukprot:563145_1
MESKRMHCTNQQISNHAASNTNVRTANLSISIRTSHDDVMRPISPPSDPFTNDPQSNGTSYPILWRVHGPTPHNWRCFGLDVGRHCYLLIQYIVLLAIYIGDCFHPHTIIIQIAMESNTNDAIPIHLLHALSRLLFWRTGASTMATPNPNQTRLRAFRSNPIPLPRSTFHRIEIQVAIYGRIHFYPHEASTTTASEPFHVPHLMTLSPIAPHPSDHPMSHGRPIPNPSNVASPQCIYIGFSG